jgi:hypothetical protein
VSSNAIQTPRAGTKGKRLGLVGALAAVCALGATGCYATVQPEPIYAGPSDVYVTAGVVPTDIYAYPRVRYGGTYVYYVDGRWYRPTARGWVYYRREPVELGRYRSRNPRYYNAPAYPRDRRYRR